MLGSQPLLTALATRGISGLNAHGMFAQDLVTLGLHSGVEATMLNTDRAQAALVEALRRANPISFNHCPRWIPDDCNRHIRMVSSNAGIKHDPLELRCLFKSQDKSALRTILTTGGPSKTFTWTPVVKVLPCHTGKRPRFQGRKFERNTSALSPRLLQPSLNSFINSQIRK